ncbi:MAG: hypothetical protein EOO77_15675 [Oxalobacteraceae bacterium]|nr:MAG: hypothetical protein EOO77_15675 [Oxalobacteraceae bacterium]
MSLPAPRLELRWRRPTPDEIATYASDWMCDYNLVLPLGELDVRSYTMGSPGELTVLINTTASQCADEPTEPPFRDSSHAQWDAKHVGNPPVYIVWLDGSSTTMEEWLETAAK